MKTVGAVLRESRLSKGYSLADIERATKIRAKFLEAIEEDDFGRIPGGSYAKGFVKNYAEYLGVSTSTILAFFRRQTREAPRGAIVPRGLAKPLNRSFILTPGRFLALVVSVLVIIFLTYLGWQYRQIQLAPPLSLESPKEEFVSEEARLEVIGSTDPDATVTVNGVSVLVRSDGRFFDQVKLELGVNTITIAATSRFGKATTITRDVGYQP